MKVWSWNVNGLRAAWRKGFGEWLEGLDGEIVGVQETRARRDQVPRGLLEMEGWPSLEMVSAQKAGYSGVGIFSRRVPDEVRVGWGVDEFDAEGRCVRARYGELVVVNVYFPNGSGTNRDQSRVPYKLAFTRGLREELREEMRAGRRVLVMGDFNIAHEAIDLARPSGNRKTSGFLQEERDEFSAWLSEGWVDTFRCMNPGLEGAYTWWSTRRGVRERNVGWRIDYVLASPGLMPFVRGAFICPEVLGSDHCPLGVELEDGVCGV